VQHNNVPTFLDLIIPHNLTINIVLCLLYPILFIRCDNKCFSWSRWIYFSIQRKFPSNK